MNPDLLNNWKEIASYLGRGTRTVQRWEEELGMPVRRIRGHSRSAVSALKSELDGWMKERSAGTENASDAQANGTVRNARALREMNKEHLKILHEKRQQMRSLLRDLSKRLHQTREILAVLHSTGIIPPPDFV